MTYWQFSSAEDLRGDWLFPTETRFGAGRIAELPSALAALGIRKPLIVTDTGLAATPIPARIAALAPGSALWADCDQNPTGEQVMVGVAAYHDHGADAVIALGGGGGSALDSTLLTGISATLAGHWEPPRWEPTSRLLQVDRARS